MYLILSRYSVSGNILAYFLSFRLNNPLLSHESRLQPKVNPSPVSGNDLKTHTAGLELFYKRNK